MRIRVQVCIERQAVVVVICESYGIRASRRDASLASITLLRRVSEEIVSFPHRTSTSVSSVQCNGTYPSSTTPLTMHSCLRAVVTPIIFALVSRTTFQRSITGMPYNPIEEAQRMKPTRSTYDEPARYAQYHIVHPNNSNTLAYPCVVARTNPSSRTPL